jgi:hypothetical protein
MGRGEGVETVQTSGKCSLEPSGTRIHWKQASVVGDCLLQLFCEYKTLIIILQQMCKELMVRVWFAAGVKNFLNVAFHIPSTLTG